MISYFFLDVSHEVNMQPLLSLCNKLKPAEFLKVRRQHVMDSITKRSL